MIIAKVLKNVRPEYNIHLFVESFNASVNFGLVESLIIK